MISKMELYAVLLVVCGLGVAWSESTSLYRFDKEAKVEKQRVMDLTRKATLQENDHWAAVNEALKKIEMDPQHRSLVAAVESLQEFRTKELKDRSMREEVSEAFAVSSVADSVSRTTALNFGVFISVLLMMWIVRAVSSGDLWKKRSEDAEEKVVPLPLLVDCARTSSNPLGAWVECVGVLKWHVEQLKFLLSNMCEAKTLDQELFRDVIARLEEHFAKHWSYIPSVAPGENNYRFIISKQVKLELAKWQELLIAARREKALVDEAQQDRRLREAALEEDINALIELEAEVRGEGSNGMRLTEIGDPSSGR